MPDLITHTLFIYPTKKIFPKELIFILIGSILPDLLGRVLGVFILNVPIVGWYQTVIHTPVALLLFVFGFSFFFPEKERKQVFLFLSLGAASHLFLDLFQKNIGLGYLWLFPFSFKSFRIPLIWPDDTIFVIPVLIFINLLIYFSLNFKKYAKK